jgi:hypothetical protein
VLKEQQNPSSVCLRTILFKKKNFLEMLLLAALILPSTFGATPSFDRMVVIY